MKVPHTPPRAWLLSLCTKPRRANLKRGVLFSRIKVNVAAEVSQGAMEGVLWGAVEGGDMEWVLAACGVLLLPKMLFRTARSYFLTKSLHSWGLRCSRPSLSIPMVTSWVLSSLPFYRKGNRLTMGRAVTV